MPEYLKAGQRMWIGKFPASRIATEVGESCKTNEGSWFCSDCQIGFPHNLASGAHADDNPGHQFVWMCFEHGPEAP